MKKVLCILTALFALSWASAQTGSSGQGQTGGSSDQASASSTDQQQTKKANKKGTKKGGGETTLTGCLSGPNDEGAYVLERGKRKVEVGGNDDLSKHVGHTVKLHGMWAKSGEEIGEKEGAEKGEAKGGNEEKGERHFKVSSIDHVSDTCKAGATAGTGEHKMNHHHKKGAATEPGGAAQPSPSPSK
jgi:hypothetical protein